jgi:hypothetical protein
MHREVKRREEKRRPYESTYEKSRSTTFLTGGPPFPAILFYFAIILCPAAGFAQNIDELRISLPEKYGPDGIVLGASRYLYIRNDVQVLDEDGTRYGMVGSTGTTRVEIHNSAEVGNAYSNDHLWLHDNSSIHGDIWSPNEKETQNINTVTIDGIWHEASVPENIFSWRYDIPEAVNDGVFLTSGQSLDGPLAPGRYSTLQLHAQTSVTLTSGVYVFDAFQIESDAEIVLDDSNGAIFIYVIADTNYWMRGDMTPANGDYARVLLAYTGFQDQFIEKRFVGTIVSPNAKMVVRSAPEPHKGAIFAKDIEIDTGAIIQHAPFGWLIDSIDIYPEQVCANEPINVHVDLIEPWNIPADNVFINGKPGMEQTISFAGIPGNRKVSIGVIDPGSGLHEFRTYEVDVVECTGVSFPKIRVVLDELEENTANFYVLNAPEFGDDITYEWDFGDGNIVKTADSVISKDFSSLINPTQTVTRFIIAMSVIKNDEDISSGITDVTFVSTYGLNKANGIINPELKIEGDSLLSIEDEKWIAEMAMTNFEDEDLVLNAMQIEFIPCNTNSEPTYRELPVTELIEHNSTNKMTYLFQDANVPQDACWTILRFFGNTASTNMRVMAYRQARIPGRQMESTEYVSDPTEIATISSILEDGNTTSTDRIRFSEVNHWYDRKNASELFGDTESTTDSDPQTVPNPLPSADEDNIPSNLDRCDPESEIRNGYACVPYLDDANNPIYIKNELQILNARKGDALLSRGCGFVGNMLRPYEQFYTHTGIMTKNFKEVTHSYFETKRMKDYPVGSFGKATNGHQEHAVKYGFPGSLTATVEEAYTNFEDEVGILERPEYETTIVEQDTGERWITIEEKRYRISGFNYHPEYCGEDTLVHAQVLKPFPEHETRNRPKLIAAADYARQVNAHYRFYTYTNGGISEDPNYNYPGDPNEEWIYTRDSFVSRSSLDNWPDAKDSVASSCALFVRNAMVNAGFFIKGEEEKDGMFRYRNRIDSVEALYNDIYNMAYDEAQFKIGNFNWLFGNAADDVATQLVSCFVFDRCDTDTFSSSDSHDDWKNPGEGYTVSPHNLFDKLVWSSKNSEKSGPYGDSERLLFTNNAWEAVYTWEKIDKTGEIKVIVTDENDVPLEGAEVTINKGGDSDTPWTGVTNSDGAIEFSNVPVGNVEISTVYGRGPDEPVFQTIYETVTASDELTEDNTFTVRLPAAGNPEGRLITLAGIFTMFDDKLGSGTEDLRSYPVIKSYRILPGQKGDGTYFDARPVTDEFSQCHGQEIQAQIKLELMVLPDNTPEDFTDNPLEVKGSTRLYEGWSCSQAWEDGASSRLYFGPFLVNPQDVSERQSLHRNNTDAVGKDDYMEFQFYIIHDYAYFQKQDAVKVSLKQTYDFGDGFGELSSGVKEKEFLLSSDDPVKKYQWNDKSGLIVVQPGWLVRSAELWTEGLVVHHPGTHKALYFTNYNLTKHNAIPLDEVYIRSMGWTSMGSTDTVTHKFYPGGGRYVNIRAIFENHGFE